MRARRLDSDARRLRCLCVSLRGGSVITTQRREDMTERKVRPTVRGGWREDNTALDEYVTRRTRIV